MPCVNQRPISWPLLLGLVLLFSDVSSLSCSRSDYTTEVDEPLHLNCYADEEIDGCRFKFPNLPAEIIVFEGVENPDYEFVGNFPKGECGIRFKSAKKELEGVVTVSVYSFLSAQEEVAKIEVKVLQPPKSMHMDTNGKYFEFKEGQSMRFECSCSIADPMPNMTLSIGSIELNATYGKYTVSGSQMAEITNFDKKVTCNIYQPHLEKQKYSIERPLTIFHRPNISDHLVVVHEADGNSSFKVIFSAYPKPYYFQWNWAKNGEKVENCDTWLLQHVEDSSRLWEVGLVGKISMEDAQEGFFLIVENSEGRIEKVVLSASGQDFFRNTFIMIFDVIILVHMILIVLVIFRLGQFRRFFKPF